VPQPPPPQPAAAKPGQDRSSFQQALARSLGLRLGLIGGLIGIVVGIAAPIVVLIASKGRTVHYHSSWSPGQPINAHSLPAFIGGLISMLVVAGILLLVLVRVIVPMLKQNRLARLGQPARATVVSVSDTGVTVNQNPQVKLELDVQRPHGASYRATTTAVVSRLNAAWFAPGQEVDVRVDPKNRESVALVGIAASASSPEQTHQVTARLEEIDAYNRRVGSTGEPARATIVKAEPMNVMVNGNNPAMTFLLKVHPVGADPFLAEAAGVIGAVAVHKYQTGCDVYVRFEAADKTRVALDHS
jgi:hypothetical protein